MNYKHELGIIGNIKLLFTERNSTNNKVFNETTARQTADTENREAHRPLSGRGTGTAGYYFCVS